LAAHRGGIKTVIIPADNERDLKEIPANIKADLVIKPVKWIDEVLEIALQHVPTPLSDEEYRALEKEAQKSERESTRLSTH
jgi:ATP-dependent Lon protease